MTNNSRFGFYSHLKPLTWARQAWLGRGSCPPAGVGHKRRTRDEVPGGPRVVHDLVLPWAWEGRLRGQGQGLRREVQDGVLPSKKTNHEDGTQAVYRGNSCF